MKAQKGKVKKTKDANQKADHKMRFNIREKANLEIKNLNARIHQT